MVNSNAIKGLMIITGYTQETLAKEMSIAETTLNLKINGKREFTMSEAAKMGRLLGVKNMDEFGRLFMPEYDTF